MLGEGIWWREERRGGKGAEGFGFGLIVVLVEVLWEGVGWVVLGWVGSGVGCGIGTRLMSVRDWEWNWVGVRIGWWRCGSGSGSGLMSVWELVLEWCGEEGKSSKIISTISFTSVHSRSRSLSYSTGSTFSCSAFRERGDARRQGFSSPPLWRVLYRDGV